MPTNKRMGKQAVVLYYHSVLKRMNYRTDACNNMTQSHKPDAEKRSQTQNGIQILYVST